MEFKEKRMRRKLVTAFCLIFACLFSFASAQVAFAAQDTVSVSLKVEQVFSKPNSSTNVDGKFAYTLTALDSKNPMPEESDSDTFKFTINGTSEIELGQITFDDVGQYDYEIKLDSSVKYSKAYKCDDEVYTVSVYVKRVDDELKTEVIIENKAGNKVDSIDFEHSYSPLATELSSNPKVKKTVSGKPSADSTFIFRLIAEDENYPMPKDSVDGVKAVTIAGEGETEFGAWSYTEEGTYVYVVSEVNAGEAGYKYDDVVYTITDVVTDEDGQLVLERTITDGQKKEVESYDFINVYDPNTPTPTSAPDDPKGTVPSAGNPLLPGNPITGDNMSTTGFYILIGVFGLIAVGCVAFLILYKRRNDKLPGA